MIEEHLKKIWQQKGPSNEWLANAVLQLQCAAVASGKFTLEEDPTQVDWEAVEATNEEVAIVAVEMYYDALQFGVPHVKKIRDEMRAAYPDEERGGGGS